MQHFHLSMPEHAPHPQYEIEQNFPRQLDSAEIRRVRWQAWDEARSLFDMPDFDPREMEDEPIAENAGGLPFGEPVIDVSDEDEGGNFLHYDGARKQMELSLRHLDQMRETDALICGDAELRKPGMRLPVLRVKQRGTHEAVVVTKNFWGSTDYSGEEGEKDLRRQFTRIVMGQPCVDEEKFQKALAEFRSREPDTSADMPVLNEEDRVEILDADGETVGTGVVRDVEGNTVRLHLHSGLRLRPGFSLRKRSNKRALTAYKRVVFEYCADLGYATDVADKNGEPYEWGDTQEGYRGDNLTVPEEMFFGSAQPDDVKKKADAEFSRRRFYPDSIPRELLDDAEQSSAFALGASGYPAFIIQGPPGTGKTTVASHLVRHLQKSGLRTLVLSHSNKGLDVLLRACMDKGAGVHRGGTEAGVCHRELRDVFIRKGLKHPHRADFLTEETDHAGLQEARRRFESGERETEPNAEEFRHRVLDKEAWRRARAEFEIRKQQLIENLSVTSGLVAGVTLNSLLSDEIIQALEFDVVIVDEASKGYIHEMLPALKKAGKQIIFIGDQMQLGNPELPNHLKKFMEDSKLQPAWGEEAPKKRIGEREVAAFDDGIFAALTQSSLLPRVMLRTNRRSLENIALLVSHAGYKSKLRAGRQDHRNPENKGRLVWVDTAMRPDKGEISAGVSKVNPTEARLLARRFLRDFKRGRLDPKSVGVISMYRAQGNRIREQAGKLHETEASVREECMRLLRRSVATVDAFQGSQAKSIYLSTVRSNQEGKIGFLDNVRRVNVAASRAQDALVIVGDSSTLIDNNPDPESRAYFEVMYEVCRQRGEIISLFSDLPSAIKPEELKSQTHAARRNRARRAWRRKSAGRNS